MEDVTSTGDGMKAAFQIDAAKVRGHVDQLVRQSVEQTLNGLLEAEADMLCGAGKYERSDARKDTTQVLMKYPEERKANILKKLQPPDSRTIATLYLSPVGKPVTGW